MIRRLLGCSVAILIGCGTAPGVSAADRSGEAFLTSTQELATLRRDVQRGATTSLRRYHVAKVIRQAGARWPFGSVDKRFDNVVKRRNGRSIKQCVRSNDTGTDKVLVRSGEFLYAKALAYNLGGGAAHAKEVRRRLMEFADSRGFERARGRADYTGRNECARELGVSVPLLIESAILLESYPGWEDWHKRKLQDWLARIVYPVTSAIADTRKNNWGTSAAFASWAIGHYLGDRSSISLKQVYPVSRSRTPRQARDTALDWQLKIIGTRWKGDSQCSRRGFQWHGGFPDELRRGSTGCNGAYLRSTDSSYEYQLKIVSHLVFHAEALRRHGNNDLYRHQLDSGDPLIAKAIKFVIANTRGRSRDWQRHKAGVLRAASHAYRVPAICKQLAKIRDVHIREGRYMPYFRVVRGDGC